MVIGSLQSAEAIKVLLGVETMGLICIDVWSGQFSRLDVDPRPSPDCPACHGQYEFLDARFGVRTTSLCGQNAVQVTAAADANIVFDSLASQLARIGAVDYNEFMLRFNVDGYEMVIFPDGRAIVKGTGDESIARSLYAKYVGM
jgi:adenylyltransferase/sulfurtransferase